MLLLVSCLFFGLKDGFRLFEWQFLTTAAIGVALVPVGLFIRIVGRVLMWGGAVAVLLAIIHAVLVNLLSIEALAVNIARDKPGGIDLGVAVLGALAVMLGFLFSRNREEESVIYRELWDTLRTIIRFIGQKISEAQANAEQQRRARERLQIAEENRQRENISRAPSVPHCPHCHAEAAGNFLVGNRIIDCLSCGRAFCGSCARGLFSKACPHCGEDRQDNIKFRDTGASWF
jgi:hypothetical protein